MEIFTTKSKAWEYEEEWRILGTEPEQQKTIRPGDMAIVSNETISAVLMGPGISKQDEKFITELVEKSPSKPKLIKAKISADTYKLEF